MVYLKIQSKGLPSLNEEAGELNFYDFPGRESNLRLLEYEAKFPTGGFTHLPKVNLFKTIYFSSYRFINFAICQK